MAETQTSWQDAVVEALKQGEELELQARIKIVPSKSDPRDFHYVMEFGKFVVRELDDAPATFQSHDLWACSSPCRGFRFRDDCSHVREVKGESD